MSVRVIRLFFAIVMAAALSPSAVLAQGTPVSDAPEPIDLPSDDRVHDELVEWWYFTGHLQSTSDAQFGFEFVFFRASTGALTAYVSHAAITDHEGQQFTYDQRLEQGDATVDGSPGQLALRIDDWSMSIDDGVARLEADLADYAFELQLSPAKSAALHAGDGFLQYTDNTWSYYYSRTRNDIFGTLTIEGERQDVTGTGWFDHQWGQFDTFRSGGWDWFSIQLDDQREIMAYVLRDLGGAVRQVDVTIVDPNGETVWLGPDDIAIDALGEWTSAATGITWPSGWRLSIPAFELELTLLPVLLDQELDTTATTGVIYWEGEVSVAGTSEGAPVAGQAYVELTGYDP